jgi:hypothetical protein
LMDNGYVLSCPAIDATGDHGETERFVLGIIIGVCRCHWADRLTK